MNISTNLPVLHVYIPLTLPQVVEDFFRSNNEETECFLLGQWERRSDRPGKKITTSTQEKCSESAIRSRRSDSRSKSKGSSEKKTEVDNQYQLFGPVVAVNVVGITSAQAENDLTVVNCGLQVIGSCSHSRIQIGDSVLLKRQCDLMLWFQLDSDPMHQLRIPSVIWNNSICNFSSLPKSQLLLFEYDPMTFQRWTYPRDSYPLGVPAVLLDGLSIIQNSPFKEDLTYIPAFQPVVQNYQNLDACFSSHSYDENPIFKRSSGLMQVHHKISILTGTLTGSYPILPVCNFLFLLLLDSVIGYFITSYLLQFPNMLGILHQTVEQMLEKLNHLLKWLRGAPAGLKLNPNLNSLYWRFFSYHIHLWANYIGILEPIFAVIIYTIQYFGLLGATVQITLLKDLLNLATFHVYCLYIYATRLYALQISAIKALCRVFFGRKYNPLRNRIDSVQLTTPELFLSSFGFVILIFLFPTTMVYYTGFLFLRVPVLLMERLLQYVVTTYNKLPLISWLLVLLKSPRVADEVYLVPKDDYGGEVITFRLCLQSTRTLFSPPDFGGGIKNLVGSVLGGTVLKE